MGEPETPEQGLIIRRKDVLVVAVPYLMSEDEIDRYKEAVHDRLPGLSKVVVLTGTSALAVYRPDRKVEDTRG